MNTQVLTLNTEVKNILSDLKTSVFETKEDYLSYRKRFAEQAKTRQLTCTDFTIHNFICNHGIQGHNITTKRNKLYNGQPSFSKLLNILMWFHIDSRYVADPKSTRVDLPHYKILGKEESKRFLEHFKDEAYNTLRIIINTVSVNQLKKLKESETYAAIQKELENVI